MRRIIPLLAIVALGSLSVWLISFSGQAALAQELPTNPLALSSPVLAGLELGTDECSGMFKIPTRHPGVVRCTHGNDPMPRQFRRLNAMPARVNPNAPATVQCDGDGVSGKRVQVMYAHASDVPDNYTATVSSLLTYTIGMDTLFNESAAQTGGTRHLRFVHDLSCSPIISSVTLTITGDDSLLNTINDLEAQGYQSRDRKYVVFMDASGPCGVSIMSYDDLWTGQNANNTGDTFGLVYKSCWSDVIAAHELMHQLGAVQHSAPHSAGDSHCTDGYDNMCRPTNGTPLIDPLPCPDIAQGSRFDCNHDDYYSTDAAPGSYLDTHWNTAVSQYFILSPSVRVGLLQTLEQTDSGLSPTDTFFFTHTVYAQASVVDQYNLALQNASVAMSLNESNGNPLCAFTAQSDAEGIAQIACSLGGTLAQPLTARVTSFSYTNYPTDTLHSSLVHPFYVVWGVLFPLVPR